MTVTEQTAINKLSTGIDNNRNCKRLPLHDTEFSFVKKPETTFDYELLLIKLTVEKIMTGINNLSVTNNINTIRELEKKNVGPILTIGRTCFKLR